MKNAKTEVPKVTRMEVAVEEIVPDELNRRITEDEELASLVDSIRVLGILQPLHVQRHGEATFTLIDGERRWRAAKEAGLVVVPCEVWAEGASPRQAVIAGLVMNEQRKAHGCIDVARRLRQIKNEYGQTQEQVAAQTGIPLPRVKYYLALLGVSDFLLDFFEEHELPLRVACELQRFEKAMGEAAARRLAKRYAQSPMTVREIEAARKRGEAPARGENTAPRAGFAARVESAFRRDRVAALAELEAVARKLGFALVASSDGVPR